MYTGTPLLVIRGCCFSICWALNWRSVVVLCSVRDQFLMRSEEIVRVCILFVALSVVLFVTLFLCGCVVVFVVQTIPCFSVYIFSICSTHLSDQEQQRFGL